MIYLHKILPLIVSPLFFVLILITLGIFLRSKKISLFGIAILIFCSLPIISNNLIAYLEKDYILQNTSTINEADAIVVLSGMITTIKTESSYEYEFSGAIDRILAGIDLYKDTKAPILILTRGKLPWSLGKPEGEYLKEFATQFGIPEENILLTDNVQNTDDEAKSVKKILNQNNKIILVTSAFHMPRAKKVFEAAGINAIPFPVDFKTHEQKLTFVDFMPSADSFSNSSHFVREMIGRAYYSLRY
ncbi:YdcF family protein [Candidatus Pelagibacter sp.]|nr:YdcF family protein [Candidatus Pelagibacter sp.]